jgi:hypothetical protein
VENFATAVYMHVEMAIQKCPSLEVRLFLVRTPSFLLENDLAKSRLGLRIRSRLWCSVTTHLYK